MEMTVRAKNKEVEFLKLAIEQRDAEIERLTELTRYGIYTSLALGISFELSLLKLRLTVVDETI